MNIAAAGVQTNPFPGLRPFWEDEEHLFFGRENQVDAMVNKLAETRFLAVVGTSGSGKSSLVNCGLRPALRQGLMARAGTAWRMAQFRPGNDPIGAMARALAQDGVLFREQAYAGLSLAEIVETSLRMSKLGLIDIYEQAQLDEGTNLLVVVDQFEELFRYRKLAAGAHGDTQSAGEDAAAFVNLLLEIKERADYPIYVVLTMRSDFLGDCVHFPGLAEAINAGQYLVPRMARQERRAAIAGPVEVGGAEISPVLLTRLVNDVGDNPDQLSILQHALNRTWSYWRFTGSKGQLELAHYEAIGTMASALDRHAEKAYAELKTARQQQICEKLFKALTDKATDQRGIRRPTSLASLCALTDAGADEVVAVIDVFRKPSRSFLMPPAGEVLKPETVIDISHESLMRVWRRLNVWVDEEARSAWTYRRLAETAALHAAGKAGLWRDPDLQLALDWREQNQPNQAWAARYDPGFEAAMHFLAQSSDARDAERAERMQRRERELQAEKEKAETQARYAKRMRILALSSAALAVIAIIVTIFAVKTQREAQALTKIADSGRLANASLVTRMDHPDLAALLAVEALNASDAPDAHSALAMALQAHPRLETVLDQKDWVIAVAFGPHGIIVSGGEDGTVQFHQRGKFGLTRIFAPLQAHKGWVRSIDFSPRGKIFATSGDDGTVRLWRLGDEGVTPIGQPLLGHRGWVSTVVFGPNGILASGGEDGTVRLWRVGESGATPFGEPLRGHKGTVWSVAFGPNNTLASASEDGTIRLWRIGNAGATALGEPLTGHKGWVRSVAFAANGILASGGADGVRLWRLGDSGASPFGLPLQAHKGGVRCVAFAPDGTLATGGDDGMILLWRFEGFEITLRGEPMQAHKGGVWSLAFGANGYLVSGGRDRSLRLWHLAKPAATPLGPPLEGNKGLVRSVAIGPHGNLASGDEDGSVRLWHLDKSGATPFGEPLRHNGWVRSVAFSPDGILATGGPDGAVRLWQLDASGAKPFGEPLRGHEGGVRSVAFGPNKMLVSGGRDGTVRLWKLGDAGATPFGDPLRGNKGPVRSVAMGPDGTLASGGDDGTVRVWRIGPKGATPVGEPRHDHNGGVWSVAFAADGMLASAGEDGTVRFWRIEASSVTPLGEPLPSHNTGIWSIAFGPNHILATGSEDGVVRLWHLDKWVATPLGEPLLAHKGWVRSVAFGKDGVFASGGGRGAVRLWKLVDISTLTSAEHTGRAAACRLASRNLSIAEWSSYMPGVPYHLTCPDLPAPAGAVGQKFSQAENPATNESARA